MFEVMINYLKESAQELLRGAALSAEQCAEIEQFLKEIAGEAG